MADDWKRQLERLHAGLVERDDPAAWVAEADAVDAAQRYPYLAPRGPVFGVAAQDPRTDGRWRLIEEATDATPQQARDALHSSLWFRARDDTDDRAVRRALLAAVAVLEREPVDELEVLGVRYRVVRGDEFARSGKDGLEPPRPTDREPADLSWTGADTTPSPDPGFVLDPGYGDTGPSAAALRLGLREFAYSGARFPDDVRGDSRRAVTTHPEIVMLPVCFGVTEQNENGWRPRGAFMPTPHDARRLLYHGMASTWPRLHQFDEGTKAAYARAAERFRAAGRADEARVGDVVFRVCRIERLLRTGPDGPEPPRPSDRDVDGPSKMHPTMDEDGILHYDD
ncbi:DUF5954 family protein [Streptomyces sp. NPDC096310]|uniref:DUF5954 family protein n=1 Tax=Streptomyces sp. NPDC096310 TaxID=3366082 RepID=UPI00381A5F2F